MADRQLFSLGAARTAQSEDVEEMEAGLPVPLAATAGDIALRSDDGQIQVCQVLGWIRCEGNSTGVMAVVCVIERYL